MLPSPEVIYFAEKFKQIDIIVMEEIQDPSMMNTASEIVKVLHSLDPVAYLADPSFVPYWVAVFRQLLIQFCAGNSIHSLPRQIMFLMQRLDNIVDSIPDVDELKEVAPVHVVSVVERRLGEVNSFLASAEVHFQLGHIYSSGAETPKPVFLKKRRVRAQGVNSLSGSKDRRLYTNTAQLPRLTTWKVIITRKSNIILFLGASIFLFASLQVAFCLASNMWVKGHLNVPEVLGVVQKFLTQCLALYYVTLVPQTLRDPHLRDMSWIWALSSTSIMLGLSSILLYLVVGTAFQLWHRDGPGWQVQRDVSNT